MTFITRNQGKEILKFTENYILNTGFFIQHCYIHFSQNFEEEIKGAIETERLVLFENLEPSYTSMEVEVCDPTLKIRTYSII